MIGGGPAGSTCAALAARAGLSVLMLEAGTHPRAHVGESLLPGIAPILGELGVLDEVETAGFGRKTGSTHLHWGRTPEWDLWFSDTDEYDHAWFVERSRFDEILFRAARRSGVDARESAVVRRLLWDGERLAGVEWVARGESLVRRAEAAFVIDASGQAALVARERDRRVPIEGLRHQAAWAHYEGAKHLAEPRREQALFVAETGHWIWAFPMGGGRTSIGMVRLDVAEAAADLDAAIAGSSTLRSVIGDATRRVTPVRRERDWSYRVSEVAGPGYLLAGDASGFIDPILSTGVFLAMHSGWHAARTAHEIVRAARGESDALAEYQRHHAEMLDDLVRMVRFYYQQTLERDDYFWESKRILMRHDTTLKPQRAFLILTSGLVANLAFEEARAVAEARRRERIAGAAPSLDGREPDALGFVCLHLRWHGVDPAAALWFLIEPTDASAPALFRTRHHDLNCIAPRWDNDPIRDETLAPVLRALEACIRDADADDVGSLAELWRRVRPSLAGVLARTPGELELVRAFGE